VSAAAALRDVVTQRVRLSSHVANAAALLLAYGAHAMPPRPNFTGDSLVEETEVNHLTSMLPTARYESEVAKGPRYTWRVLEKLVLKFQQAVDDRILTAHAAGYSTTAGDLITDLVP
jgi:hypothetical protein